MFFFALFLDVPRLKIEKQSKKLCVKLIEMFARTQCRYLYIYTVYLYANNANKADSSCSSRGSNTEAAADYSYAPLAHKLNCIKIINGITRVSVARCVSTHAHPFPAHTPHTPPHTSGAHSGVQASPVEGFASPISNYYL